MSWKPNSKKEPLTARLKADLIAEAHAKGRVCALCDLPCYPGSPLGDTVEVIGKAEPAYVLHWTCMVHREQWGDWEAQIKNREARRHKDLARFRKGSRNA